MNTPVENLGKEIRDASAESRDQFVRQVSDESRPASQVLQEQLDGRKPEDAAPLFVP